MTNLTVTPDIIGAARDLDDVLHETRDQAAAKNHDIGEIAERFLEAADGFISSRLTTIERHIRYNDFAWEAHNLVTLIARYGKHSGPYIAGPISRIVALLIDSGLGSENARKFKGNADADYLRTIGG